MDSQQQEMDIEHIVEVAIRIAARRKELLLRLRQALEASDTEKAITLAKELCGLHEQERH